MCMCVCVREIVSESVCVSALYLASLKSKAIREARWWAGLTVNSCALTEEACNKNEL